MVARLLRNLVTRIVASVVLLLLVVGLAVALWIDHVAAAVLTEGIRYAGETPATVGKVNLSLTGGRVGMRDLVVKNPPTFPEADMFRLGRADVAVAVLSLVNRPIRMHLVEIESASLRVDTNLAGTNVKVFLATIQRKTSCPTPPDAPGEESGKGDKDTLETRMIVERLVIRDATIELGSGFSALSVPVRLQDVELTDIRGPDGQGVTCGELTSIVLTAMLRRGAVKLPGVDLKQLLPKE